MPSLGGLQKSLFLLFGGKIKSLDPPPTPPPLNFTQVKFPDKKRCLCAASIVCFNFLLLADVGRVIYLCMTEDTYDSSVGPLVR